MNIRYLINKLREAALADEVGDQIMTDKEWDDLYFELKKEEEKTGIIYPDSPTQMIHFDIVSKLEKIKHEHPMLSLDKSKDFKDIEKFIGKQPFVAMFKMDGLTCSLTYEDGKLVRAETRGDGLIGEDILHNAKVVKNIPQTIAYKDKLVVDGEIICRLDDFEKFKDEYKNPRNFAAGSIRLLSSQDCTRRNLSFIAWDMIEGYSDITLFSTKLGKLQDNGFEIVPYVISDSIVGSLDMLKNDYVEEHNIYPTDGYVFKFNDIEYGKSLGQTSHHFKNAIAYKLYDETYSTRLQHITWTMGRTGVLTPVAIFDPIEIDGSIVERASLHNVSVMRELLGDCAYVGEPLKVFKANQIIPQIAEAGPHHDYGYVVSHCGVSANDTPEYCPECSELIEYIKSEDGVINAYCSNPQCPGKLVNRLDHFAGKKGLDIKGLSKATFEKLIDWGWINNVEDLFYLSKYRAEWIKKTGFGVTSVDKILKAIEESKNCSLDSFISAIGIPLIGQTVSKQLEQEFKTYEDFRAAVDDKNYYFFSLEGFGDEMNYSIKKFDFSEADRISKILNFKAPVVNNNNIEKSLTGKTIVITGKLAKFKNRNELKKVIINLGGKVTESISKNTNILINNDTNSTTTKNKKAKELNIPILSESEFIEKYVDKQ